MLWLGSEIPDPLDHSFDDINDMPFTTLLSVQMAEL